MKAGWEVRPLGEVCDFENGDRGKNYPGRKCFVAEGVPFINAGLVEDGHILWPKMNYIPQNRYELLSRGLVKSGDFLFCLRGSLGKFGRYDSEQPAAIASSLVILRPREAILPSFLAYYLRSDECASEIERLAAGAAQPNLGANDLKTFQIPIPPLKEQKRIVAVLDAAFEGLTRAAEHARSNLQNARELFESVARTIFLLGEREWPKATLPKVCSDFGRGKSRHRPRNEPTLYGGDYPFLQTGDLSKASHYVREYSQTYSEKGLAQSKLWPAETVCIAIVGATIGESAITAMAACFPDSVIGMVPDPTKALPAYVQYLLLFYKNDLKAAGEGSARDNINLVTFENWAFPIPSPSEQAKVVAKLNVAAEQSENLVSRYQTKLTDIADLRQSLLQKAFAGELT